MFPNCQTASWPNERRRGSYARRTNPYRGLEPRGRNTVLRVCWPTLKVFQVAWLLVGAPSGLRLRGEEPEKALPIEFGREVAVFRDGSGPATQDRRAAGRGAFRALSIHGGSVDREHVAVSLQCAAKVAAVNNARKISTVCFGRKSFIYKRNLVPCL